MWWGGVEVTSSEGISWTPEISDWAFWKFLYLSLGLGI